MMPLFYKCINVSLFDLYSATVLHCGNTTICSVGTTDAVASDFSAACHVGIHTIASWQLNNSGEEAATAADEETSARYTVGGSVEPRTPAGIK